MGYEAELPGDPWHGMTIEGSWAAADRLHRRAPAARTVEVTRPSIHAGDPVHDVGTCVRAVRAREAQRADNAVSRHTSQYPRISESPHVRKSTRRTPSL